MEKTTRKIIHIDMDAFFASVEQKDTPKYRGRPLVVGGKPGQRGVVAAASYEARKFGIHSAMPTSTAARLCPHAIFVYPNIARYKEIGLKIRDIFYKVTDLVEPLSLDEAFLDVTSNKLGQTSASKLAQILKNKILSDTGLTCSAGVGPNKLVAKIASDIQKPNGLVIIPPEKVLNFLSPLPIKKLWGVGAVTNRKFFARGIKTVADLRKADPGELEPFFGKHIYLLWKMCHGIDTRPVCPHHEPKGKGKETTFLKDITSQDYLKTTLRKQVQEVSQSLLQINRKAKTLSIKIRTSDFNTYTRSFTFNDYQNNESIFFQKDCE